MNSSPRPSPPPKPPSRTTVWRRKKKKKKMQIPKCPKPVCEVHSSAVGQGITYVPRDDTKPHGYMDVDNIFIETDQTQNPPEILPDASSPSRLQAANDLDDNDDEDESDDKDIVMHFLEEEPGGDAGPMQHEEQFPQPIPRPEPDAVDPGGPGDPGDPDEDEEEDDGYDEEEDEDQEDEDDTFSFNDEALNTPLRICHQGCSLREVLLLNLANSVKHKWTYESLVDSLASWSVGLGRRGVIPTTKKQLWKLITKSEAGMIKYGFCPSCQKSHGRVSLLQGAVVRCECGTNTAKEKMPFFVALSLKSLKKQLENFLSTPGIANLLRYRHTRRKHNPNAMEDIFDGEIYEELVQNGIITPNDFTLVFNTDGFVLFKQKTLSVWVLLLRLNELPPNLRQKHLFLAGIWIGKKEPTMNTFLRPFVRQVNKLSTEGLLWRPDGGEEVRSKFIPICACVDAVARAIVMNQNQFNGFYGCFLCTHQGIYLAGSMKYPLLPYGNLPPAEDRSHQSIAASMEANEFHLGQKGPSEVMLLEHFDMARGNGMDDLHPFYEGVTAFHLDLLIDLLPNAHQTLGVVNMRMRGVRTPIQMSRKWISIFKRNSWKGSQWGYFIRYHVVLCFLDNDLPVHHVEHLSMLSYALFVFSQDSIDPEDFERASEYIDRYVTLFQQYHGAENMRFNVHMLRHVAQSRRRWSSARTISTFNFESWNRQLGYFVTSPKSAADQIVARHFLKSYVHSAVHRNDISERVRDQLSDCLFGTKRKLAVQIEPDIFGLGTGKRTRAGNQETQLLIGEGIHNREMVVYDSILVEGIEFRCCHYHEDTRSDNSIAYTWNNNFITINKFIAIEENGENICGLFGDKHTIERPFRFSPHIAEIVRSEPAFIRARTLRVPAIKTCVQNRTYIVPMASCREID